VLILHVFLVTNAVRLAVGLVITAIKTKIHTETDWKLKYREFTEKYSLAQVPLKMEQIKHLIIIPNYKEEFETLCETLDCLASHMNAPEAYKVILAMEQGEKEAVQKAEKLISLYQNRFYQIRYTVHPSGLPGEARGKSSNVAWAATFYAKNWMNENEARYEIITVMDADTHLTEKYFECLTYKYCIGTPDDQKRSLFAPTLVFDRNANRVPFVVRLADICWSIGLMSNFQLPVKFPCSVYTVSMLLAKEVGFWDAGPAAIGEDLHMALKCWTSMKMNIRLIPIYLPASCSNVQADTYVGSIKARFQQSKRHLWGALDFGYSVARILSQQCWRYNLLKSLLCVYLLFEIFFQPYFGFYHLTGQLIFPSSLVGMGAWVIEYTTYIRLALIPPALIVAVAYERYHYVASNYRQRILNSIAVCKKLEASSVEDALSGVEDQSDEIPITHDASGYGQSSVAFRKWYQIADWLGLPFCLLFYYLIPGVNAMLWQIITNKLDYQVSLKPTTRTANADKSSESQTQLQEFPSVIVQSVSYNEDLGSSKESLTDTSSYGSASDSELQQQPPPTLKATMRKSSGSGEGIIRARGHTPRDSGVGLEMLDDVHNSQVTTVN